MKHPKEAAVQSPAPALAFKTRQTSRRLPFPSRRKLTKALIRRERLLQGVAQATNRLLTSTHLDGIVRALEILGKATGVDRVYVFENHLHPATSQMVVSQRFEWSRESISQQAGNPALQDLPWEAIGLDGCYEQMSQGNSFGGLTTELPAPMRGILQAQGVLSMLAVPILIGRRFWGFIGFDDCRVERHWSKTEESVLMAVAASIGGAIERQRSEEALAAEKERLSVTLRSIADGVITTDQQGRIVLINKSAEVMTGWPQREAAGKPLSEVFGLIHEKTGEQCLAPFEQLFNTKNMVYLPHSTALVDRKGIAHLVSATGAPILDQRSEKIGVVLVFQDITEKLKLQEELNKARKLESIGILAGGIAHDFNNYLTGIIGNLSLAKICSAHDSELYERLTAAEKASLQAQDLTKQLLTFAKGGAPIRKVSAIAELLRDAASFALHGSKVRCELEVPDDLWAVEIDAGQISRVMYNLIINADQSMPGGGVIRVRAANLSQQDPALPLADGKYVKISVEDHGLGIPEEHLQKIFDPYFTTKQKGSGLGLATAYSIVSKHDGHLTVSSKLGVGSTFCVLLPASDKSLSLAQLPELPGFSGRGRVLVMDDEETIRDVAGRMLQHFGYEVELTTDGESAVKLYLEAKENGCPFDAVVLDLTIPGGMGGHETLKRLIAIDPEVKAIVSSGYSNDPIMANHRGYGFCGVVAKPYKLTDLSKAIYEVISSRASVSI